MALERHGSSIYLHQKKYITDILAGYRMEDAYGCATPALPTLLTKREEDKPIADVPYAEAVGSLMYLCMGTRPDIQFAVAQVSRYTSDHADRHWKAVKRIFRYLINTPSLALVYKFGVTAHLAGFADADYAADTDTRRSRSGWIWQIGGAPISWSSTMQKCVSLSTAEAEYISLTEAIKEFLWLKQLAGDMGAVQPLHVPLYEDNSAAIEYTKTGRNFRKLKHVDVRLHFVRDVT